jgi:hypothetical protein
MGFAKAKAPPVRLWKAQGMIREANYHARPDASLQPGGVAESTTAICR